MNKEWDIYFLNQAKFISSKSKDPSTKCGCMIVRPDKTSASSGYNGFPKGMPDDLELYENRDEKYSRIIHSELNAILTARERLDGYTLYVWPFMTCERCAVHVIQAGIIRVVAPEIPEELKVRWEKSFSASQKYYKECNIELTLYSMEDINGN